MQNIAPKAPGRGWIMSWNHDGRFSILIVDDEEGIRHGLSNFFSKQNFSVVASGDFESAVKAVRERTVDVAVVDLRLKGQDTGIELLKELRGVEPDLIEIVITGYGSIDTAVASMKMGAADYMVKPIDNVKLLDCVYKNLEMRRLKKENVYLRRELMDRSTASSFVTNNRGVKDLLQRADKIKNSPVTVMITGESGTGKEVLARYIHFTSARGEGKFVTINCAALSETLLLSELFGHERGAYTGAVDRQIGKFEIADKGTVFLDEIGDMTLDVQAKLLRVIEENSFERVGGTRRIAVDARIIVATNRDLSRLIAGGKFREDLFYRINVVSFHLPPLRARREDIPPLIEHFVHKYNRRYNKKLAGFDSEAVGALVMHGWPGNVRELENVVNQVVLLSEGGVAGLRDLKGSTFRGSSGDYPPFSADDTRPFKDVMAEAVGHFERELIRRSLERNAYNRSKTARELSVTRKTLAEKIRKYGLINR
jgi:two-component system response regulator AtoC